MTLHVSPLVFYLLHRPQRKLLNHLAYATWSVASAKREPQLRDADLGPTSTAGNMGYITASSIHVCGDGCKIVVRWDSSEGEVWNYCFFVFLLLLLLTTLCDMIYRHLAAGTLDRAKV